MRRSLSCAATPPLMATRCMPPAFRCCRSATACATTEFSVDRPVLRLFKPNQSWDRHHLHGDGWLTRVGCPPPDAGFCGIRHAADRGRHQPLCLCGEHRRLAHLGKPPADPRGREHRQQRPAVRPRPASVFSADAGDHPAGRGAELLHRSAAGLHAGRARTAAGRSRLSARHAACRAAGSINGFSGWDAYARRSAWPERGILACASRRTLRSGTISSSCRTRRSNPGSQGIISASSQ